MNHLPGSNGGVHRGPNRTLRINTMRGIFLQALTGAQARLVKAEGRKNRVTLMVPMAMADDLVAGMQLIAREGAKGRHLKEFLILTFGIHKAMQPGQYEKNGNGHAPRPATFVVAGEEEPSSPDEAPAPPTAPGTLVDANGQEYVAG